MKAEMFLNTLKNELGVDFYTGVPDSQLKALCDILYEKCELGRNHIVAANEGAAVALAAGHYIATGRPALVYMQNSGIGNALNPITSLLDEKVYAIPCVFVIGWRGEPGVKDEPQHLFQGEITLELLKLLKIESFIISDKTEDAEFVQNAASCKEILKNGNSVAFVVKKEGFIGNLAPGFKNISALSRERAISVILDIADKDDIFVSTTGKASRELFEIREKQGKDHAHDFLTVGSMGHASMIALGIALELSEKRIWCVDGDGAALMHLGSMSVLSKTRCENLIHIILNNAAHESVGGMPVAYGQLDFCQLAKAAGYDYCRRVDTEENLKRILKEIYGVKGTKFIEICVSLESRRDLGRPTASPKENRESLMRLLGGYKP